MIIIPGHNPETYYLVTVGYGKDKCFDGRSYTINETHFFITDDLRSIKKAARINSD